MRIPAWDGARLAVEHGADGVIVSTHGGRQVDGSMRALLHVLEAVGVRVPVLIDRGVHSGGDVGQGAAGRRRGGTRRAGVRAGARSGRQLVLGVREVIGNPVAALDLMAGLLGCSPVEDLQRATLVRRR